jgi:hypothetical protein
MAFAFGVLAAIADEKPTIEAALILKINQHRHPPMFLPATDQRRMPRAPRRPRACPT